MRFSYSAILFAGNALAVTQQECFADFSADLAAFADCANTGALTHCLSQLEKFDDAAVKNCYTSTGCSDDDAAVEAHRTVERCEELVKAGDLKKRYQAAPLPTLLPRAEPAVTNALKKRAPKSGTECFTTTKTSTESCPLETKDGHVKTVTCFSTDITTSECSEKMICTTDASHNDICMEKVEIDTAGIIIAICFAVGAALMIGYLTFMCCRDKKEQKRLVAKAETVALARAATKKQRAAQRQPLIRNASGTSNPAGNPFQDQNRI
ncbi:hypothetical protein FZEAL_7256 [Fusarium zealandicum]|uniref:Uncharacterized protein n=1 Tax=Fusarium zealandicum TaxID=1053134 RepID=A0A8H4UH68_9HYPO|nr:hypothetical protein FZEAL_7256 [Fusarium zealandicum]